MRSHEFKFDPEQEVEINGPQVRSEMLDSAKPSVKARNDFFELLTNVSIKKNAETEKILDQDRHLMPFENIAFVDHVRPIKKDKSNKLFVCDFDDTFFDTTGFHEGIAKKCEELGIGHDEWFTVYDDSKELQKNKINRLYSRAKHIAELQKHHPEVADEIKQVFNNEPIDQYVDMEVVKALNMAAARSDTEVMILTHGDLETQKFKLSKVPELAVFASTLVYTQVTKKEFLEKYLSSDQTPIKSEPPRKDDPAKRVIPAKVFLLDDNPSEVENFIKVGENINFQAMRLRLPRAKRYKKEQKSNWWGTVLESTELPRNYAESELIYRSFLSFLKKSNYQSPGGNMSLSTRFGVERVNEKQAKSNKTLNEFVFGSIQQSEKMCAKLLNGEYALWPSNYKYHGGSYSNGGTIKDSCKVFRFDNQNQTIEEDKDILSIGRGWQKADLDELLNDDKYIF